MATEIIKIKEGLTKENFWDALYKKYPEGTQIFCDWIDLYKKAVNWDILFNQRYKVVELRERIHDSVKFHDLPFAMQYGIWLEFIDNQGECNLELEAFTFNLRDDIELYVKEILQPKALMFAARQNPIKNFNE